MESFLWLCVRRSNLMPDHEACDLFQPNQTWQPTDFKTMFTFLITLLIAVTIHLLVIAAAGWAIGVTILVFSLGLGPTIFRAGILRLGAIPAGGYVRFRDSRQDSVPPEQMKSAFDGRSTTEQIAIMLSGCCVLLAIAVILDGAAGLEAFLSLPLQVFQGARSPFNEAQVLLRSSSVFVESATFGTLVAVSCAKLAALNLLPLPGMNGGAVLAALGHRLGAGKWWPSFATRALVLVLVALFLSWCLALLIYLVEA